MDMGRHGKTVLSSLSFPENEGLAMKFKQANVARLNPRRQNRTDPV